ncbi:response regulator [Allocoleopsis sp.]|uniref:response regulator n=1 Tax=Allocoleopsis sp. TaxID=3088169 RepID=UPI002FD5B6CC
MNHTILLVEENSDDQFLIKRALDQRFLNKTNLIGEWSSSVKNTAECRPSNLNQIDLYYPILSPVSQYSTLAVAVEVVQQKEEAIKYLKGKKNDTNQKRSSLPMLILIGISMPHFSGLCLLSWIKRQPELMHIPVVVISDVDKKDQAINLGAIAYIFKTLCFTDLTEVVRAFLLSNQARLREQEQSKTRCSEPLRNLATPSKIREPMNTRGVIKAASWRRIGGKINQSSLQVPM